MLRDLNGVPFKPLGWLDASKTWLVMRRADDTQCLFSPVRLLREAVSTGPRVNLSIQVA